MGCGRAFGRVKPGMGLVLMSCVPRHLTAPPPYHPHGKDTLHGAEYVVPCRGERAQPTLCDIGLTAFRARELG